jgi:hypothetical protein
MFLIVIVRLPSNRSTGDFRRISIMWSINELSAPPYGTSPAGLVSPFPIHRCWDRGLKAKRASDPSDFVVGPWAIN